MQYAQQVRHLLWAAPVYVAAAGGCGRSCQFGSVKRQLWRVLLLRVMVLLLVLWGMLPSCCRRRTVPCLLVDRAQRLAAWQQRVGGGRAGQRLLDGGRRVPAQRQPMLQVLGHPARAASLPLGAALLAGHYLRGLVLSEPLGHAAS